MSMKRAILSSFVLLALLLAACGSIDGEPAAQTEPTAAVATAAVATAAVATATVATVETVAEATSAELAPVVVATNTYIPLVEAEPTGTSEPTPTATPVSPIAAVALEPILAGGLAHPTFITHAFDERLFVLEQIGRIRIVAGGELLPTPFLDITDRVGSVGSEQGLLGLAFHPNYATPDAPGAGTFYVNYTDYRGNTHISRFSVSAGDPNRADPGSEVEYLFQEQPYPNHNGGSLAFGPDGYLYAGLGDGGSANDPLGAGQRLDTWLGKLLRLDVTSADGEYVVPADNPFVGTEGAEGEIWAYGLRNPWRFSFDRATGDVFIADVGQNQWEEVNFQPAGSGGGENYGWNIMEATHCFQTQTCDQTGLVLPIFEYTHSQGCSVTGGYVYRGAAFPEMAGNYFVTDYCTGIIWRLFPDGQRWQTDIVLDSDLVISTFGEDVDGEIYLADYVHGAIYRLRPG
jgi:glucose/arabinose dehydrogenase